MRHVEIRRHAQRIDRSDQASHLSRGGVEMARQVGVAAGPFELVVSSPITRAIETAIAMGFTVDEELADLVEYPSAVNAEVAYDDSFAVFGQAYRLGRAMAAYADKMAVVARSIAARVDDGGSVLAVSHGGIVEACAVGAAPDFDHSAWGPSFGYCEGVRIGYDEQGSATVEILRVGR